MYPRTESWIVLLSWMDYSTHAKGRAYITLLVLQFGFLQPSCNHLSKAYKRQRAHGRSGLPFLVSLLLSAFLLSCRTHFNTLIWKARTQPLPILFLTFPSKLFSMIVLGVHGKVSVVGELQGWLLWEAAGSFHCV